MRAILGAVLLLGLGLPVAVGPAMADEGPVIVIPGRRGVPVMINGRDASFAMVEGDWGLGKSVHYQPVVSYGWIAAPGAPPSHYFPSTGRVPGYGRHEIEPPARRALPPPAQSYQRFWGIESQNGAVTDHPPYDPPQVVVAPDYLKPPHRPSGRPEHGHDGNY
ncbi:MAG: hypothetical protein EPO23_04255 [Xanthobacteraceae bacterium]|nr:MAG: hypothetical protein EPO23_04255 [Xanthobacteraceae bacterium]